MHRRAYQRLKGKGMRLEAGLWKLMREKFTDYTSLLAYAGKRFGRDGDVEINWQPATRCPRSTRAICMGHVE
jgi:hypothetical protein